ncbi:hypothetical protein M5K25_011214 [Dendrobium thyrsiflorum]|uniref:Uncharacterized protein n=1 Tax=Dendrobium thyrsiflorum TaxID=117978 RepID=A0ABD0V268_DENTH
MHAIHKSGGRETSLENTAHLDLLVESIDYQPKAFRNLSYGLEGGSLNGCSGSTDFVFELFMSSEDIWLASASCRLRRTDIFCCFPITRASHWLFISSYGTLEERAGMNFTIFHLKRMVGGVMMSPIKIPWFRRPGPSWSLVYLVRGGSRPNLTEGSLSATMGCFVQGYLVDRGWMFI